MSFRTNPLLLCHHCGPPTLHQGFLFSLLSLPEELSPPLNSFQQWSPLVAHHWKRTSIASPHSAAGFPLLFVLSPKRGSFRSHYPTRDNSSLAVMAGGGGQHSMVGGRGVGGGMQTGMLPTAVYRRATVPRLPPQLPSKQQDTKQSETTNVRLASEK